MVNATGRVSILMEEDRHVPRRMIRPVAGGSTGSGWSLEEVSDPARVGKVDPAMKR